MPPVTPAIFSIPGSGTSGDTKLVYADGSTADGARIRSASIKGSSLMAELGIRMEPTATSPWKMDIGLTGHAGKHKGIGGSVAVGYLF